MLEHHRTRTLLPRQLRECKYHKNRREVTYFGSYEGAILPLGHSKIKGGCGDFQFSFPLRYPDPSYPLETLMADFSKHQQKIIKRYYDNRDDISLQRVQEIVTELYLSEGKKRERYWKTLASNFQTLGVPQVRIDRLLERDDPKAAAELVEELLKKQK